MSGICYVVATPIGNLEDISYRAARILGEVDKIAAEDTRVSRILLNHLGINTPMMSLNARSESAKIPQLIQYLKDGKNIAIISDAGTPGISDPGIRLVNACAANDIDVVSIPGPSAVITALAGAGLPTDKFWFEGFLPHKKGRQTRLKFLSELPSTIVLYESPYRVLKTLTQLLTWLGPKRKCVIGRELTKKFEEFRRGTIPEVLEYFSKNPIKGEFVIILGPAKFVDKGEGVE